MTDRHPRFLEFERARAARVPFLRVGETWAWDEPDHHHLQVLALEQPGPGAEFPWPRVTCQFASGSVVTVGATAFCGASRVVARQRPPCRCAFGDCSACDCNGCMCERHDSRGYMRDGGG